MIYGVKLLQWILSASTCDPVTQFVKSTRPYGTWEKFDYYSLLYQTKIFKGFL